MIIVSHEISHRKVGEFQEICPQHFHLWHVLHSLQKLLYVILETKYKPRHESSSKKSMKFQAWNCLVSICKTSAMCFRWLSRFSGFQFPIFLWVDFPIGRSLRPLGWMILGLRRCLEPEIALWRGERIRLVRQFFLKGLTLFASICMRPVAQIAERNRYAAPVLLVHLSASCSVWIWVDDWSFRPDLVTEIDLFQIGCAFLAQAWWRLHKTQAVSCESSPGQTII